MNFKSMLDDILSMVKEDVPAVVIGQLREDGIIKETRENGRQKFSYNRGLVRSYLIMNGLA